MSCGMSSCMLLVSSRHTVYKMRVDDCPYGAVDMKSELSLHWGPATLPAGVYSEERELWRYCLFCLNNLFFFS